KTRARGIESDQARRRRRETTRPRPTTSPVIPSTPHRSSPEPTAGAAEHPMLAVQLLPLAVAVHEPVAVTLRPCPSRELTHASTSLPTSTYCPLQKSAPFGDWHAVVHPPWMSAVHCTWQSMFACTWQDAPQLAWHCASHEADGGVALQLMSHRFVQ